MPARVGRRVVPALIATAFAQGEADQESIRGIESPPNADAARTQWRGIADQLRPKIPKLTTLMDASEHDVLAHTGFPAAHRAELHATNPIARLNAEIKRRTEVAGISPNENAITRLIGATLMEQSEERAVKRARYMTLETMAPVSDDPIIMLPAVPGA